MKSEIVDGGGLFDEKGSLSRIEDVTGLRDDELQRGVANGQPRLRGRTLTYALTFIAGTGFALFGFVSILRKRGYAYWNSYDQGVMSSLLTAQQVNVHFYEEFAN